MQRKSVSKAVAFLLALLLAVTMLPAQDAQAAGAKKTTGISFSNQKLDMVAGESTVLKVTTTSKKSETSVTFSSDNRKVAKVQAKTGRLTAVKPGTATITAKTANGSEASYKVRVYSRGTTIVSTQKQLNKKLKALKFKTLVLSSATGTSYTIPAGNYEDVALEIDVPNADVSNYGKFQSITVCQVKTGTYHEYAEGNQILVYDDDCSLDLQASPASVSMLSDGRGTISMDASVGNFKIVLKGDTDVVLNGEKNSGVEVEIADKRVNLTSSIPAKIDITAKKGAPVIQLMEGSEGTKIQANDQKQMQKVENKTEEKISFEIKDTQSDTEDSSTGGTSGGGATGGASAGGAVGGSSAGGSSSGSASSGGNGGDSGASSSSSDSSSGSTSSSTTYPKMEPAAGTGGLTIEHKDGQVQIGSCTDTLTLNIESDTRINERSGDKYYRESGDYEVELIHADGTKNCPSVYSSGISSRVGKYTGTSENTATITLTGIGRYVSVHETEIGIRLRMYDYTSKKHTYSNMIIEQLAAYSGTTTVNYSYMGVEDEYDYSDEDVIVDAIQSGVVYQSAKYYFQATHLTWDEVYGTNAITPIIEWCDANGAAADGPKSVKVSIENNDGYVHAGYETGYETTDRNYMTAIYQVDIVNRSALEAGTYYFRLNVKGVRSDPVAYKICDVSADTEDDHSDI